MYPYITLQVVVFYALLCQDFMLLYLYILFIYARALSIGKLINSFFTSSLHVNFCLANASTNGLTFFFYRGHLILLSLKF